MAKAVMLDLETLSVLPTACILTIGAVKFDPRTFDEPTDEFYIRINVDEQISLSRSVDDGTLEWWSKQPDHILNEALDPDNRISLNDFRHQFNRYLVGAGDIWTQGVMFDIGILENLYRQMQWNIPWQYWQIQDSRTIFKQFGDPRAKDRAVMHNALEDAKSQAKALQQKFKDLGKHKTER